MNAEQAPSASAVRDPAPCWCGSDEWKLCFRTDRFGLVRCPRCATYRLDPRPLQTPEGIRSFYDTFYSRLIAAGYPANGGGPRQSRFWRVADAVPALRAPGGRAADIGCGDGRLCAELLDAGWSSVVGVEVSAARLERARRTYPQGAFHASIDEARLAPRSLDLVVLDNVIEHLLDPVGMLAALRGSIAPAGRLVLITPNMRSGHFRLLGRRWTTELSPDQHIHLFTAPALRRLVERAGYGVEATGSFHLPFLRPGEWTKDHGGAPVRTMVWRAGQEAGSLLGRLIAAGPMLYVVAHPVGAPVPAGSRG